MTNLKKYTLSDLQERTDIMVRIENEEQAKKLQDAGLDFSYFEDELYYGYLKGFNRFLHLNPLERDGRILLESIDEIDLGDEGKEEIKPITCKYCGVLLREGVKEEDCPNNPNRSTTVIATDADCVERIQQLESEIARLEGELDKSQEAGKCIAEKLADEMKEKVAYMEDINELKDDNKNLLAANLHITEKYNELIKLRESPQISQYLTKRERMAWEIVEKSIEVYKSIEVHKSTEKEYYAIIKNAFEYVDTFLAKSKEVKP